MENNEFNTELFTPEELELFKQDPSFAPTDDELETVMETRAILDATESLPNNNEAFLKEVAETFGDVLDNPEALKERVKETIEKNPELSKNILTTQALLNMIEQAQEQTGKVEKISTEALAQEKRAQEDEVWASIMNKVKNNK
ncbi:MAG: hypothetical protein IJ538_00705 [Clostridia bacterium]|nr:hypothetical protein [Clostridia bacterium]